jgi:hypothetical protein
MDATPFWSHPEFTKAAIVVAGYLGSLITAAAAYVASKAIYTRVRAMRARKRGERTARYRRAEDDWREDVQKGLAALRADFDSRVPELERGVTRLQGMATQLKREVTEAGRAMKASAKDMRVTREELVAFMGEQKAHREWLKEWREEVMQLLRDRR